MGFSVGTSHRRDEATPYVEIWKQPLLRWLVSHAYHLWEKWTEPVMKHISKWHQTRFGEADWYIPLVNRRDIRCYHLAHNRRVILAITDITKGQYDIIGKSYPDSS